MSWLKKLLGTEYPSDADARRRGREKQAKRNKAVRRELDKHERKHERQNGVWPW